MAEIAVIGAGYVGLVTSAGLAKLGHNVTCIEIDTVKLASLKRTRMPFFEPDLEQLVREQVSLGRLSFTDSYSRALLAASFCFVAVNTPPLPGGAADTRAVFTSIKSILHCRPKELTLVVKSTVPVGTGDQIKGLLRAASTRSVRLISNPEFLRQGTALKDFLAPDRIVLGGEDPEALESVQQLFCDVNAPVIRCSYRSAELAKYAANAYLATRISFINEMAAICDVTGADVQEVAQVMGLDHRVGTHYLNPGLGWGGSCLPKDVMALSSTAQESGYRPRILDAVAATNTGVLDLVIDKLRQAGYIHRGSTVGVLGLAFKPGTDDVRGAPALDLIRKLFALGCQVKAHDPLAINQVRAQFPEVWFCRNAREVAYESDAIVLATEWPEYLAIDWNDILVRMRGRGVFDGRNVLDGQALSEIGFEYMSIGRPRSPAAEAHLQSEKPRLDQVA